MNITELKKAAEHHTKRGDSMQMDPKVILEMCEAMGQGEPVALGEADLEAIARRLLADEYEKHGIEGSYPTYANLARHGKGEFTLRSIRAIVAALKYTHPSKPVQPAGAQEPVRLNDDDLTKIYMRFVGHQGLYPQLFEDIAGCVMTAMFEKSPPPAAAINEQLLEVLNWVEARLEELGEHELVGRCAAAIAAAKAEKAKGGV